VTALFGKLRRRAQVLVTAALVLSLLWPIFVIGVFAPGVSSWALAMVPLHHWVDDNVLRLIWLGLAALTPLGVGALVHFVVHQRKLIPDALRGYQLALGFSAAFVVVVITVPIVKISSLIRRWSDEHVYVQAREHAYDEVLRCLVEACRLAGFDPKISDAPRSMVLATTIMRAIAGSAVTPFVTEKLRRITADGLELYLYPGDLLVRGQKFKAARVRAMIAYTGIETHAYLVDSDDAKSIQDSLARFNRVLDNATASMHTPSLIAQLQALYQRMLHADVTFEQWSVLDGLARKLERRLVIGHMTQPVEMPLDAVIESMRNHPGAIRSPDIASKPRRVAVPSYVGPHVKGTP
jgi:hypothetical protein